MFQEKQQRKKTENIENIIVENFLNVKKEAKIQIQETQRRPSKINIKKPTQRNIVIKLSVKDRESFETSKSKVSCYIERNQHKTISGFVSVETTGQNEVDDTLKILKKKL